MHFHNILSGKQYKFEEKEETIKSVTLPQSPAKQIKLLQCHPGKHFQRKCGGPGEKESGKKDTIFKSSFPYTSLNSAIYLSGGDIFIYNLFSFLRKLSTHYFIHKAHPFTWNEAYS